MLKFKNSEDFIFNAKEGSVMHTVLLADPNYFIMEEDENKAGGDNSVRKTKGKTRNKKQ